MTNSLLDLEEEILGTCLTQTGAIREVALMLPSPSAFQSHLNRLVYEQMLVLQGQDMETDLITLNYHLTRKHGPVSPDSAPWMSILTSYVPAAKRSTGNLSHKCALLQQESIRLLFAQQLSQHLVQIQEVTSDPLQLMDKLKDWIESASDDLASLSDKPFSSVLMDVVDRAEEAARRGDPITGLKTGLAELDGYLKGLHPQTLTILAARPSMGKTAQACQIAYNITVEQKIPVAFFSLEMSREQLATRQLAIDTGIKNSHVTAGVDSLGYSINFERLRESAKAQGGAPLFVFSQLDNLSQIKNKISQLIYKHGIKLVIVDYLQLIETGTKIDSDSYARVTKVSRELKKIARNYNIPVLALAQLSREVERRADKRPQLSDLKESGALEQDADNVIFLYRPGYYSKNDKDGYPVDMNLLANIVAKNRQGSTHKDEEAISLHYDPSTNQIKNYPAHVLN